MRPLKYSGVFLGTILVSMGFSLTGFAYHAGDLYSVDSIVGNLRYVPATGPGGFVQGEPTSEPCQFGGGQFTHILTRNIAVMETSVTQQMWTALQTVQPTLPPVTFGPSSSNIPANNLTWYEAVLFANLLSVQRGVTRCYYTDSGKSTPVDSTNYISDSTYCDFTANGYRLPTEGEREYFTRAGTAGPFSVSEPNYDSSTCGNCASGLLPGLEGVAWFCANLGPTTDLRPVKLKAANPWTLWDVHGNAYEWCWDWEGSYPNGTVTDYTGPASGSRRLLRGGGVTLYAVYSRSDYRDESSTPSNRYSGYTFRLVSTIGGNGSGPTITKIAPKTGTPGSTVTIIGSGFSTNKKLDTVYFSSKKTNVSKAAATKLSVKIPRGLAGSVGVRVVVNGNTSNTFQFQVK